LPKKGGSPSTDPIVELCQRVVIPTFFSDNPRLVLQLSYYNCMPRPEGEYR